MNTLAEIVLDLNNVRITKYGVFKLKNDIFYNLHKYSPWLLSKTKGDVDILITRLSTRYIECKK